MLGSDTVVNGTVGGWRHMYMQMQQAEATGRGKYNRQADARDATEEADVDYLDVC